MKLTLGKIEIEFSISINFEKLYMRRVKNALREGRRLQAVKIYKDNTGLGLRESKEAVDLLLPKYYKDYKPTMAVNNPSMYGVTIDIANPVPANIIFVGTYVQCLQWKIDNNKQSCNVISLTSDEVNNYVRTKLSQPNPNAGSETKYRFTHGVYVAGEIKPVYIGSYGECNKYVIGVKAYDESDDPTLPRLGYKRYSIKPLNEFQLKQYNSKI